MIEYEGAKKMYEALPGASIQNKHPAGVCASFAMDWVKKKIAGKPVNESTYTQNNGSLFHKSRENKIIDRQKKYEKGDLLTLAKSYSLKIEHLRSVSDKFSGEMKNFMLEQEETRAAGYYYFSFQISSGEGHAIGWDKHAGEFCDANMGIFKFDSMDLGGLLDCINQLFNEVANERCKTVELYRLTS